MLLVTLAMSPLRQIINQIWPLLLRRMLGLFCFFYAFLHVCVYVLLDRSLDFAAVFEDLIERPFITAGFAAFVLLVILAVTSNNASMKWLRRRWTSLHRWIYIALFWPCCTSAGWPRSTAPRPRSISASPCCSLSGEWREH